MLKSKNAGPARDRWPLADRQSSSLCLWSDRAGHSVKRCADDSIVGGVQNTQWALVPRIL